MKTPILLIYVGLLIVLTGCYLTEDAADVNQERISVQYCTVFNGTRQSTSVETAFKFGHTPLHLSNPIYFENGQLFEKRNPISGIYYQRQLTGIRSGSYEWTDETGRVFNNQVELFTFVLVNPPNSLKKKTSTLINWEGDLIPYSQGTFSVTITSKITGVSCSFYLGETLRITPDHLDFLPAGEARFEIARKHSEPIDEGTQAGGDSWVSYVHELDINIIE